ncbi:hypothetical protein D9756_001857 [Leucocoprinus leucothites]|uniref:NYN domain-containing protein n=1 Tax=Leucocoprinus leucothites TaxID=201217 RepID=A0A8H5LHZ0_9AGAR|nr:hypothetical protein D9756_001857 [Leucoagaricus leucothites]
MSHFAENCPAPANASGWETVKEIRRAAQNYGSIKVFRAYLELPAYASSPDSRSFQLRSELQSSGVSLTDCPHNGRKDVADKMILVDMMAHAIDNPAPWTYILVTGDRDFAYAISVLNLRRYQVILVSPPTAHISLKSQATACLDWNQILARLTASGSTRKPVLNPEPAPIPQSTPTNISLSSWQERRASSSSSGSDTRKPGLDEVDLVSYLRGCRRHRQSSVSSEASQSIISESQNDSTTHTAYFSASETLSTSSHLPVPSTSLGRGHRSDSTTSGYFHFVPLDQPPGSPLDSSHPISTPPHGVSPLGPIPKLGSEYQPQVTPRPEPNLPARPPSLPISKPSVPKMFIPLVNLLREHLAKGSPCPSREDLARVLDQRSGVYSMAGVEKFGQYIALAEKYRIVTQGRPGVALRYEWT